MLKLYCHNCECFIDEDDAERTKICDNRNNGHGDIDFEEWTDPVCPHCHYELSEEYECTECDELAVYNQRDKHYCRHHLIGGLVDIVIRQAEDKLTKLVSEALRIEIDEDLQTEITDSIKSYYDED